MSNYLFIDYAALVFALLSFFDAMAGPWDGVELLPRGTQGVVSKKNIYIFILSLPPLSTTISNFVMFSAFVFVVHVAVSYISAFPS